MGRPSKYANPKEAAENNLYSKMGGLKTGLSLERFISKVTSKCECCGQTPSEHLSVARSDGGYILRWNYIVNKQVVCGTCKKLAMHFDLDYIVKHCARIMAKRMHDKRRMENILFESLDTWADSINPDPGITPAGRSRGGTD